jgi:hypothetical protein
MGDLEKIPPPAVVADGRHDALVAVGLQVSHQQGALRADVHGEDDGRVVDLAVRSRGGAGHDVARRPEHVHPGCPQAEGITLAEGDPIDAQAPRGEAQRDDPWTVAGHA